MSRSPVIVAGATVRAISALPRERFPAATA